ncbi:MAG: hypothetical protein AMXMBFR13_29180 [Phycisphaerae bacterium]
MLQQDAPIARVFDHRPLVAHVETAAGSGEYREDPRMTVRRLFLGSDDALSEAEIELFAGPIDSSTRTPEPALTPGSVLDGSPRPGFATFLSPDQRVIVGRPRLPGASEEDDDGEEESTIEILFSGYCDRPMYNERSDGGRTERGFTLLIESMLKRISDAQHAQIIGRRMRSPDAQRALDLHIHDGGEVSEPFGDPTSIINVQAQPCTFNALGQPNRAAVPISAQIGSEQVILHVFADDNDPTAEAWTWAQALRYLVFWHLFRVQAGASLDDLSGGLADGNVIELTSDLVTLDSFSRPASPVDREEAFKYAMLGMPKDFKAEGFSFPEAMILLTDETGTHFTVRTENMAEGEEGALTDLPIDRLYIWARGSGPIKDLYKEATFADRGMDAGELFQKHNVHQLSLEADYSDVIPLPIVLGDVRRYEVTLNLTPGWKPDSNLDIDTGDAELIKTKVKEAEAHHHLEGTALDADTWFRRYHKQGKAFHLYSDVGRRWVLNETGFYKPWLYARDYGPWGEQAYVPWEPSSAGLWDNYIDDDGNEQQRAILSWARVGRPLSECFSADAEHRSYGIVVEVTYDNGINWRRFTAACRSLPNEAGIHIEGDDLTDIVDPTNTDMSFWEGMLRGTARLRVTGVIPGDERLQPNLKASKYFPATPNPTSRIINVAGRFRSNRRDAAYNRFADEIGGAPNPDAALAETVETADDLAAIQSFGESLLELLTTRQLSATPVIPWLSTDYLVGDCIREIRGAGIRLHTTAQAQQRRYVDVVGIEYAPSATTLILDDMRLANSVNPDLEGLLG